MAPDAAPPRLTPAGALAAAWLLAVALVAAGERAGFAPSATALASSPERLSHGAVWTLATSALVIDGPPVGQLVMTALATAYIVTMLGGRAFWLIAAAGHLGATLVAYAGIALLWLLVGGPGMEQVTDAPDFGISAVWAALLGALAVAGWRLGRCRRRRFAAAAGAVLLATFAVLVPLDGELSDVEHLLAFVAGALTAAWLAPKRNAPLIRRQETTHRLDAGGGPLPRHPTHEEPRPCRAP